MRRQARLGDIWSGICIPHDRKAMTGVIITASMDTKSNRKGAARLNDIVVGNCGHTGIIISASKKTFINKRGAARTEDAIGGNLIGIIITGSPDTESEG